MLRPFFACLFLTAAACAAEGTPGGMMDVTASGAVGDGVTLNTGALQRAIDACSSRGGGTLSFPAGRYLTGTIQLKDNVIIRLDAQAVLLGSPNAADYRNLDPFTAGDGVPLGDALIVAVGARHVGVVGAGAIDGQGRALKAAQKPYKVRPFLMRWLRCEDVTVRDVHLTNPGAWTLNFFQTRGAVVERITIRTRDTGLANNDGIDLDSCEGVRIRDCDIESGDDAICLKATSPLPCRDIAVNGCKLSTKCNAFKLGTESLGDFDTISLTDCQVRNTGMAGIALYAVDGAQMHGVTIANVTMDGVTVPISIRLGARLKTFRPGDHAKPVGTLHDITIQNVKAMGAKQIGVLINGIPGHPIETIRLEHIDITVAGGGKAADAQVQLPEKEGAYPEYSMFGKVMPAYGLYLRHVRGVRLKSVRIIASKPDPRPAMVLLDAENVAPANFTPTSAPDSSPSPTQ